MRSDACGLAPLLAVVAQMMARVVVAGLLGCFTDASNSMQGSAGIRRQYGYPGA